MLKKIFLIFITINLLSHCEYQPVYSNQNNIEYKIIIKDFTGDKYINNLIATSIKKSSKDSVKEVVNVSFNTKYSKIVIAKNSAGTITDYQSNAVTTFKIEKKNNSESFVVNEKFNFQKMTDKYEEKNYERNIKKNLANSVSQKLLLRLAMIK